MFKRIARQLGQHQNTVAALAALLGVGLLATILIQTNGSVAYAVKLATTHQPERFTELYFNNHRLLPTAVTPGTKQKCSFHITNHEAATVTYRYVVIETTGVNPVGAAASPIATGVVTLANGQGTNQAVTYTAPSIITPFSITVELLGQPEMIDFRSKS